MFIKYLLFVVMIQGSSCSTVARPGGGGNMGFQRPYFLIPISVHWGDFNISGHWKTTMETRVNHSNVFKNAHF